MAEYIDRDSVYATLADEHPFGWTNDDLAELFRQAKAADVVPVKHWISVEDRLPEPEQEVLVLCETKPNRHKYQCLAFYVPEKWLREKSYYNWDYEACDIYSEKDDDYYVNSGWYESIHNWDDYNAVGIADFVTHWMPLPEPPKGD